MCNQEKNVEVEVAEKEWDVFYFFFCDLLICSVRNFSGCWDQCILGSILSNNVDICLQCYVFYFGLWESVLCCGRRVDGYSVMWESVLSFILRAERLLKKEENVLVNGQLFCKYLGCIRKWCLGVRVVQDVFLVYRREVFVLFEICVGFVGY